MVSALAFLFLNLFWVCIPAHSGTIDCCHCILDGRLTSQWMLHLHHALVTFCQALDACVTMCHQTQNSHLRQSTYCVLNLSPSIDRVDGTIAQNRSLAKVDYSYAFGDASPLEAGAVQFPHLLKSSSGDWAGVLATTEVLMPVAYPGSGANRFHHPVICRVVGQQHWCPA